MDFAISKIVPQHFSEVKTRNEAFTTKAMAAVKERLTKEITYWDNRAQQLKDQELAGKSNAKLNSGKARQRAEELERRLKKRMQELEEERQLSPLPPVVVGGALVIPIGLLNRVVGAQQLGPSELGPKSSQLTANREAIERLAMEAVMRHERSLGFEPRDVSTDNVGYDIESKHPLTGRLRFVEVKGRVKGADTVTITRNEMTTALNSPDEWRLAIVIVDGEAQTPIYVAHPFTREPQFGETSANFNVARLIEMAEATA
ncbi:MAG: DUF3883 domain-containing protein [Thermoanaerobaculia bacterium]